MALLDINSGDVMVKLNFSGIKNEIEFLEQFNDLILIKSKD